MAHARRPITRWNDRLGLVLVALVIAPSLAGCSSNGDQPHVLRVADGKSDYALNPYFSVNIESNDIGDLTAACLLRWNNRLELEPELLTEVPTRANGGISRDFRTIVLHLRRGLRWSDGAPLTAEDVLFTAREMTGPGGGPFSDSWRQLRSVRALDDHTVVMVTRRSDANFTKRHLFGGMRFVLPEHVLAGTELDRASAYNRRPIGAGPYRFVKSDPQSEIVLEANPFYFRGAPKLKQIIFRIVPNENSELVQIRTHELDMVANLSEDSELAARAIPRVRVLRQQRSYDVLNVMFNATSPIGKDLAVRRALRYATNRPEIASAVFHQGGQVFEEALIPQDPMHADLPVIAFDPAQAKRLLDGDGWRLAEDGVRVKHGRRLAIALIAPSGDGAVDKCVEILRSNWSAVGVEMDVVREPASILFAPTGRLMQGKFDATIRPWTNNSSFFDIEFGCAAIPPNGFNVGRYCDRRIEHILSALQRTDDASRRKRLYGDAQQILVDSAITINLVQLPNVSVLDARVHGTRESPWNFYDSVKDADAR